MAVNTFRHDLPRAASSRDAWPLLLLLGSCLFFFDVLFRRVQVGFAWAPRLAGLEEPAAPPAEEAGYTQRLLRAKKKVWKQRDEREE